MLKGSHILETKEKQKKSITGTTVWEKSPFDYTPLSQSSSTSKPSDKRQPCPRAPPRRTGANGKHHNGFDDFKSHLYLSAKTSCPEAMVSWAAPAQPPLLLSPPSPMHGSAFPLLYWPKCNHAVRGFVSYLPLLLPGLMCLMKACYNPLSCHFSGRSFGFSSTPARREGEVLLGLGLVKLLSLTVLQATCLTFNPTTFT